MANTKAAVSPRYRMTVQLDDGRTHVVEPPRTNDQCLIYCHKIVQEGVLWENVWFPPSRIRGVHFEPIAL